MEKRIRYSPEVRERAVRMVLDQEIQYPSQWATIRSIASKIGCTAETLRKWVHQAERDAGLRLGQPLRARRAPELEVRHVDVHQPSSRVSEVQGVPRCRPRDAG